MTRVAESIVATTGGRLDALVVTHQHWDHVSGFLQAEDVFNRLAVVEVWLAWTEDPADELARELAHRRRKAVAAVESAAMRLSGRPSRMPSEPCVAERAARIPGEMGAAAGRRRPRQSSG